jgi:hypothetical protein
MMDYIKEIEYQIAVLRELNESAQDLNISATIAMMAEKAFYMSQKVK